MINFILMFLGNLRGAQMILILLLFLSIPAIAFILLVRAIIRYLNRH